MTAITTLRFFAVSLVSTCLFQLIIASASGQAGFEPRTSQTPRPQRLLNDCHYSELEAHLNQSTKGTYDAITAEYYRLQAVLRRDCSAGQTTRRCNLTVEAERNVSNRWWAVVCSVAGLEAYQDHCPPYRHARHKRMCIKESVILKSSVHETCDSNPELHKLLNLATEGEFARRRHNYFRSRSAARRICRQRRRRTDQKGRKKNRSQDCTEAQDARHRAAQEWFAMLCTRSGLDAYEKLCSPSPYDDLKAFCATTRSTTFRAAYKRKQQ